MVLLLSIPTYVALRPGQAALSRMPRCFPHVVTLMITVGFLFVAVEDILHEDLNRAEKLEGGIFVTIAWLTGFLLGIGTLCYWIKLVRISKWSRGLRRS